MKSIAFLLVSSLTILMVTGNDFEDIRECPSGYFYAGEDTPPEDTDDLQSYWEVGRTPVYSCYKRVPDTNGINDGLEQCYTSVMDSDNMEARVVIFEDAEEVKRVFNKLGLPEYPEYPDYGDKNTILTSAMKFDMKNADPTWIYLGTNYTKVDVKQIISDTSSDQDTEVGEGQCLTVARSMEYDGSEGFYYTWTAVSCVTEPVDVLCEIRIETVTYAWIPNWLTITLLILTIVLLVTCCMAALSYKHYTPRPYRGSQQSSQVAAYPVDDAPPKYSDVTGVSTNEDQGKFDKYKNKGREILAKIYVVKDN